MGTTKVAKHTKRDPCRPGRRAGECAVVMMRFRIVLVVFARVKSAPCFTRGRLDDRHDAGMGR